MWATGWNVLLVDANAAVLAAYKLALQEMQLFGLPVKVYEALSKNAATDLINSQLKMGIGTSMAAVAFIAADLESPLAGLELCRYTRQVAGDNLTQIYLYAPDPAWPAALAFAERYNINGLFRRAELFPDRLAATCHSAFQQYYATISAETQWLLLETLLSGPQTHAALAGALQMMTAASQHNGGGYPIDQVAIRVAWLADGRVIARDNNTSAPEALSLFDELNKLAGRSMGHGDKFVLEGNNFLYSIAPGPTTAAYAMVGKATHRPPDAVIAIFHRYVRAQAILWQRASERSLR